MNSAANIAESVKTTVWNYDPAHTRLEFAAKHMVIATVRGHFDSYSVNVKTQGDDFLTADVEVKIDVASITTGIADRDAHLKSDDFFNAEKYPQMVFKGKSINKVDDQNYK
ncbi:MAG: YceI family protein, partial [Syntrophothermus sp.]